MGGISPVTSKTSLVGLMAWPVGHSLSPVMQNAAFNRLGLDWIYLPLPVQPSDLGSALKGLAALSFKGCNISVPHKTAAMQHMDDVSPAVKVMSAVNTITVREGRLLGSNTDPDGFINALLEADCYPGDMRILLIGAGGAARAAVYGLSRFKDVTIVVVDVVAAQADQLVSDLGELFPPDHLYQLPYDTQVFTNQRETVDLVVNASPVGMHPEVDRSPWPENVPLPESGFCFDMVYNPLETMFLRQARESGMKTISGLGMLINQGALSFAAWTGMEAPVSVMRLACLANIKT
jgi:shikimate dehydrogenase